MPILLLADALVIILGVGYFGYQAILSFYSIVKKPKHFRKAKPSKVAVLISARNEEIVIGKIITDLRAQQYPQELLDVWVVADNCTDKTAQIANKLGAHTVERFNKREIGKGFALSYLFEQMKAQGMDSKYDFFIVQDADNELEPNYIDQMNRAFKAGYDIVTSFRSSKNLEDGWVAASSSMYFIRESRMLNQAKMALGISCNVGGTGFLFSQSVMQRNHGWKHHLLTEDLEFSMDAILAGDIVAYNGDAVFYDEQPVSLKQSWTQRVRWMKGFLQVFRYYGPRLLKQAVRGPQWSAMDLTLLIFPWMFIVFIRASIGILFVIFDFVSLESQVYALFATGIGFLWGVFFVFVSAVAAAIVERKNLQTSGVKLFQYLLTFPIFCLVNLPAAFVAIFTKPNWKPIVHNAAPKNASAGADI